MKTFVKSFVIAVQIVAAISLKISLRNNSDYFQANKKAYSTSQLEPIRQLRVLSTHFEPFMYQDKSVKFYNGLEYKLIKTIADKEHFNLQFISQNNLASLNMDNFRDDKIDLYVGGIYPKVEFLNNFVIAKPYYNDNYMWCIQKAKYFPSLITYFLLATPECWLILIFGIGYTIGFLLYLMIQFDLEYKHRNQRDWHYTTWLIALPAVIGVNPRFQPKHFIIRFFYGYLLFIFMLQWVTILFPAMQYLKYPKQMHQKSTIAEIVEYKYRLAGSSNVLNLISFDDQYRKTQIESFYVCPSINQCLDHLKHDDNDDLAVGGSRQRILNSCSYSPSKIFCFDHKENIASYQPALLIRKDFVLTQKINRIISNAFEGGLFVKWDRESQRKKEHIISLEPEDKITLQQIATIFVCIACAGSFISILSFVSELIIYRKMKQEQRSWIWMYLEQFFNGKRHYLKDLPERLRRERAQKISTVNRK